jgi:TIR domain-containing protein
LPDEKAAFDVFLSYNNKDKPAVRQIAEALRDRRGLKVWLDEWELPPGVPSQDELENIIRTVPFHSGPGRQGWLGAAGDS